MDRKKIIGIIVAVALIVAGLCGYFFYYIKTPAYSLGLVKDSMQKHDIELFKKHVDLDSLLSRGFDDMMAVGMESDDIKDNPLGKDFADGLIKMIKPTIVSSLKDDILRSVESGEQPASDSSEKDDPAADVQEKTGMKSSTFKGIDYTKKDGKTATVGIKIGSPELGHDYTLDIKMRELNDGTWQIVEISNLKDYLAELDKAQKASLKSYVDETSAITAKYNADLDKIRSSYPQSTATFWSKYKENLSACRNELSSVEVPPAGKKLADTRSKFYDVADQQADLMVKVLNGDHSSETMKQLNDIKIKVKQLSSQRDAIVEGAKKS